MPKDEWRNADLRARFGATGQGRKRPVEEKPVTRMPWGKYKGTKLTKVPLDYLKWLLKEMALRPLLRAAISLEVLRRK